MENTYSEVKIKDYLEQLGSAEPTPGGGAAAALEGAQGAALLMMVANLTIGKEKYKEYEALNIRVRGEASEIRAGLLAGIDRDAEVFGRLSDAYALPKTAAECSDDYRKEVINYLNKGDVENYELSDEDVMKARSILVSVMAGYAAEAPLDVMEDALRGLKLAAELLGNSNPNLESDVYAAAYSLHACLKTAALNVKVNLPAVEKMDAERAERIRSGMQALIEEAAELKIDCF